MALSVCTCQLSCRHLQPEPFSFHSHAHPKPTSLICQRKHICSCRCSSQMMRLRQARSRILLATGTWQQHPQPRLLQQRGLQVGPRPPRVHHLPLPLAPRLLSSKAAPQPCPPGGTHPLSSPASAPSKLRCGTSNACCPSFLSQVADSICAAMGSDPHVPPLMNDDSEDQILHDSLRSVDLHELK